MDRAAFTVLSLGARGRLDGVPFALVGQSLARSKHGAWWTEWRLRLEDGRERFLVEASGRFVLFREASLLPEEDELAVGAPLDRGWIVAAHGRASRVGQWGEAAGAPREYRFAELVRGAPGSTVQPATAEPATAEPATAEPATAEPATAEPSIEHATIEWPHAFLGRPTTLEALALLPERRLRLHPVPELSRPAGVTGWLPVGTRGALGERSAEVLACVARRAGHELWEEFLVATDDGALVWLVVADGEWTRVHPSPPWGPRAEDHGAPEAPEAVEAEIVWLDGELPWEAAVGDRATLVERDGVTREASATGVTWARSTPLPTESIAKHFGKRALPRKPT